MYNVDEVIQVISIGLIVAGFLFNTNRFLKSIELCKECLFILKERAVINDKKLSKSFYVRIYFTMWKACSLISDNSNAKKYAKNVVDLILEIAEMYLHESEYAQAKNLFEKALLISKETGNRSEEAASCTNLGAVYLSIGEYEKAREYLEKSLATQTKIGDRSGEASSYGNLGVMYKSVGEYEKAREYLEKSLAIQTEIGDRNGEASSYTNLGVMYKSVGEYEKAREYLEKSLAIQTEIGDRNGEASSYGNLGGIYNSVGEYERAREYLEKSLAIKTKIGDRSGEATSYTNLGLIYNSVGEYERAREYLEKSLAIKTEIGDRSGEATSYTNLGVMYQSVGEYERAREYLEKSLAIQTEIGDRNGEASSYGKLGVIYQSVGEYKKAREYLEKSLAIQTEIGDRSGEASSYTNLGVMYQSVGEYKKAREYLEKSLAIKTEIADRRGEASSYTNLGLMYQSVGEYDKAREYLEKSLAIKTEIADRRGEAYSYTNLGLMYQSVGEYDKAVDYWQKSLAIARDIGNRQIVATSLLDLGTKFLDLGKYSKANEYNKKALAIFTEIGDREGVAAVYINQGGVEQAVGNLIKAKEYFDKALAIVKEIGSRVLEANSYLRLGRLLFAQSDYDTTEECIKKALALSDKTGDITTQMSSLSWMATLRTRQGKIQEAMSCLRSGIDKCEKMRGSLRENEQMKISILDHNIFCYRNLCNLLCETGNPTEALYVSELSKARALADLLSAQYSLENQISTDSGAWSELEDMVGKVFNRTCLYVSYYSGKIYLWIIKAGGVTDFQVIKGNELLAREGSSQRLEQFFDFRSFGILPEEICEDQSLHGFLPEWKTCKEDSNEGWRFGVESKANQGPKMDLPICYKLIIAPVVSALEGPEIIIVPDRALYQIPFAALTDESGKYLSETFRIRVAPSLTTLKLINESPAEYHCQTGALIVGNPDVGEVHFRGKLTTISRLQCAENEARMVAKKLGVEPLLGRQATKEAVIEAINSVALIHIAAHGDAERGAIALAPPFHIPNRIPQEGLYLLTMSDISKIQLRAKLVVLSCCHSARGQTKAEGAVGIARAFLGSGARSVLVALWALDDKATEQLMIHFYDHLVAGESAGESLHEAMKWMRSKGYEVNQWAPFILIGDDVIFDFGEKGKSQ